jgi:dTDP-4-dehydrorhamnose reductase
LSDRKILISGSGGLLGPYLANSGQVFGEIYGLGRNSGIINCDLTDPTATQEAVSKLSPDITIHAAALTSVDRCETKPDEAKNQNVQATRNLVQALPSGSRLIYISTDQVYPDTIGPHKEGSEQPVNEYGRSKLAGETEALLHDNAIALRTNMFGPSITDGRRSLSDFFVGNLTEGVPTTFFRDILFTPLHMDTLAEIIWKLAFMDCTGVFNLGSREGLTKAEFGLSVAVQMKIHLKGVSIDSSTSLLGRAKRASDLRMDVSRIENLLKQKMPTVLEEIGKL